jgi:hypothetical protein
VLDAETCFALKMFEMNMAKANARNILAAANRVLASMCLTLSVAVFWGQSRRAAIRSFLEGVPLTVLLGAAISLLVLSMGLFGVSRKLAICGVLIALWSFFVCTLPTL